MRRFEALWCIAVLCLAVTSAGAQSIDIVDASGSCDLTIPPLSTTTFYVRAVPGGAIDRLTQVEFRVDGLLAGLPWFMSIDPPPTNDVCMYGCDLFGAGVRMVFPVCVTVPLVLFSVSVFAFGPIPEMELSVRPHTRPPPVFLPCSMFTLCAPDFFNACVPGGRAFVNSTRSCDEVVGVEPIGWSQVKALYGIAVRR